MQFDDLLVVNQNKKGVMYLQHFVNDEPIAKQCTSCGEWKFLQDYNKAGKGFAGTHSLCKPCHRKNGVEYRTKKNEEYDRAVYEMERAEAYRTQRGWY